MYHPTRGGARGGAAEFSWETVKNDKDREFYLGNSVAAPTGRWQAGRDINWYNKDKKTDADAEKRREELREIKRAEEEALNAKLGIKLPSFTAGEPSLGSNLLAGSAAASSSRGSRTGANNAPLDVSKRRWGGGDDDGARPVEGEAEGITEADRKLARKLAKEQVKRQLKEESREERRRHRHESERRRRSRSRSRSRSPTRSRYRDSDDGDRRRERHRDRRSESHRDRDRDEERRHRHHRDDRDRDDRGGRESRRDRS